MKNQFLTIRPCFKDLEPSAESFVLYGCRAAMDLIYSRFEESMGYRPHGNNRLVREVVFPIKASTSLSDVTDAAFLEHIRKEFGIVFLQASIDRRSSMCHMLFGWLDTRGLQARVVVLNPFRYASLSVYIMRKLHLPRPSCADTWQRYFLLDAYQEDNTVFDRILDLVMHDDNIKARDYDVLQDSLMYAKNVCKGILK